MKNEELQQLLEKADPQLMESYMRMFERILLYNMATAIMPPEAIEGSVDLWDKVVKKAINSDASKRTDFLEGSPDGRMAKLEKEPDGEDLRHHCLEQHRIARSVIVANLGQDPWENSEEPQA